jgi:DNA polymerase III epsilon subunit-like protein
MGIIILDTETLGLPSKEDAICQVALLSDIEGEWIAEESYIKNNKQITSNAMAIHHITNEMVEDAPIFEESTPIQFLRKHNTNEHIMVLQNAPFDLGVLANMGFIWKGRIVDTLICAKHLLSTPRYALQYLRYELGLYKDEKSISDALGKQIMAHDALSDAIVTKLLLNHLLTLANNDIQNLLTLSVEPVLLKIVPFGKYRGESFESIADFDPKYFRWCLSDMKKLNKDARNAIEFWLEKQ